MRKIMKRIVTVTLCLAMLTTLWGCEKKIDTSNYPIQLTKVYNGAEVDLCCADIREYLDAETEEEQLQILAEKSGMNMAFQPLSFSWSRDDACTTYTVYFADNEAFENPMVYETPNTILNMMGMFVPGKTYYWKVVGDAEGSCSWVDSFRTVDAPVRYISTTGIPNVRDIGGWETEDGKKVRYELVYRGGKTNSSGGNQCQEEDKVLFAERLGVKTEIDLRTQNADDGNQTMSVFGYDVSYLKTPITGFCYILPNFHQTSPYERSYDERTADSVKRIFTILADEENYPVYFHCNAGADRTATIAFLINGLLGVSYEDLTKDYELTSFSVSGARWRSSVVDGKFDSAGVYQDDTGNYVAWGKLYDSMMRGYGTGDGKLSSAIENYLIKVCNLDKDTLDSVRNIMLED